MVTLFLRQGENGKQVLLSFPTTTPAEKEEASPFISQSPFSERTGIIMYMLSVSPGMFVRSMLSICCFS